jgi:multisubunit Na+/H+ antiporter MnhF subunit
VKIRNVAMLFLTLILLSIVSGCATVRAYERESLADRIMLLDAESAEAARELHWIEAREGSTGGTGGAGGGCACN